MTHDPNPGPRAGPQAGPRTIGHDPHAPVDARVNTHMREGLTGTAPADLYKPLRDPDQITLPPDGRPADEQPAWRKDFPIDWPQDHYVARRDFAKFMVLTSLAFAVGQLWIAAQNAWRRRRGEPPKVKIASLGQLPVGSTRVFNYPGEHDTCVLVHAQPGKPVAYGQKCTHLSCAVVPEPRDGVIACPCHEGLFDLKDGRPIAGPPRRPLPRIRLEQMGNHVYAVGVEYTTT